MTDFLSVTRRPRTPAPPAMLAATAFAGGIIAARAIHPAISLPTAAVSAAILLALAFAMPRLRTETALATVFLTGMAASTAQTLTTPVMQPPETLVNTTVTAAGTVSGMPTVSEGIVFLTLRCDYLSAGTSILRVNGLLPCSAPDTGTPVLEDADVMVTGRLVRVPEPLAPEAFGPEPSLAPSPQYRLIGGPSSGPAQTVTAGGIAARLREHLAALADRYPFGGHAALVKAMTVGDRSGFSREDRNAFARAGMLHLMAVSGLHAGIVAGAVFLLLGLAGVPNRWRLILTAAAIFGYAALTGFRPPTIRAALMGSLLLFGRTIQRPKDTENILFAALLVMLAVDPSSLETVSLQLSFAAVWTISVFADPVMDRIRGAVAGYSRAPRVVHDVTSILVVSTLAFAGTAPVVAWRFGTVPLLSIPINVLAVPLGTLVILGGMLSYPLIAMDSLLAPLVTVWTGVTGFAAGMLEGLASAVAGIPFAAITYRDIPPLVPIAVALWGYLFSRSRGRPAVQRSLVYLPLALTLILTWQPLIDGSRTPDSSTAVFFDVGQGDASLLLLPDGGRFLIDTGTASAARAMLLPSLAALGIDRLDGIILSHLDNDHAGGLSVLDETVDVTRIFTRAGVSDSLAAIWGKQVIGLDAGDSVAVGIGGFAVLSPSPGLRETETSENNRSLLIRWTASGRRILYSGDIEPDAQAALTVWGDALRADVVKIPHHGAQGLDRGFIDTVSPSVAVISCGLNNRYGHPAPQTLVLLGDTIPETRRTDLSGTIIVRLADLTILPAE